MIKGNQPGSWAESTVKVRLPDIARRTLAGNDFPPPVVERLRALIGEIPAGPIRPVRDSGPDVPDWEGYTRPYLGQNWLDAPWFFVETYFYRRILEASGYFGGDLPGYDPFRFEKTRGRAASQNAVRALCSRVQSWLDSRSPQKALPCLLHIDLWGNQADLSLWPVDDETAASNAPPDPGAEHLLVDHAPAVSHYLANQERGRVDILLDNAGLELLVDLQLAGFLLAAGLAAEVHLHCKAHPTFVSDAIVQDVREAIQSLAADEHPAARACGQRLQTALENRTLHLHAHFFWNSPLAFWDAPADLHAELSRAALIISKGDANYRRLLGDRLWPFDTPFEQIMAYTPAPLLALRVFKAELAAGLSPAVVEKVSKKDPHWLTNGRWGVIQWTGT